MSDLAQGCPFGKMTPHCLSTSTGPLVLGAFALPSSFFFLAFGPSSVPSAFRFLPFSSPAFFPPFLSSSESSSLSSPSALRASSSLAASFARSLASRASFFRWAFSFLRRRHAAMCAVAAVFRTDFLQCLHCCKSGLSSSGRPVWNVSRALSSRGLTGGLGDSAVGGGSGAFFFFLVSGR